MLQLVCMFQKYSIFSIEILPQMIELIMQGALFLNTLIFTYIENRQYKKLNSKQPEESKKIADDSDYKKSVLYNRSKLAFGMFMNFVEFFKTLIILHLLPSIYHNYISKLYNPDILLVMVSMHLGSIIDIPFDYYYDFVIESKHGFNKKTHRTFITDVITNFAVSSVLMYPIISGCFYIINRFMNFFIYLWAFYCFIQVLMMIIYPNYIAPLYNKFEPMEDSSIKTKILELANKVGFKTDQILVMDGSKRTGHSNAYFVGLGKTKKIVFYDTILKQLDEEEVLAVLCHELGHWKHGHIPILISMACSIAFVFIYAMNYFVRTFTDVPMSIRIIYFYNLSNCILLPLSFLSNSVSRILERQADQFAVNLGYGQSLSSGLIKISKENKSALINDSVYSVVKYSHPPVLERIALIKDLMSKNE